MNTLKRLSLISLIGTYVGFGMNAVAGDIPAQNITVRSRVVTFYDLDLAKPADNRTLLHRIRTAALAACGRIMDNPKELRANVDGIRCVKTSFQDTVAQVNSRFTTDIEKVAGMQEKQRDLVSKR